MNRDLWERLQELFAAAMELPESDRDRFLVEACGSDEELLAEARRLVRATPPPEFVEPVRTGSASELFGLGLEGRRLGDFRLIREIGRGGMGVVYEAVQDRLERSVALKLLPLAHRDTEALARFEREAKAASALQHPGIVQVLASGESEGLAWYAMSLVDGHDLGQELRRQSEARGGGGAGALLLPPFEDRDYIRAASSLVADLAEAVECAHAHGVVHRDIKPQNVLLDREGRPQVTDFGLARDSRFGSLTATSAVQGTPHYMSPEQARTVRETIDHRTDVYSLCVVLYEMLALRRPFEGSSSREVIDRIATTDPPALRRINPRVPRDLAVICAKGMSKRPAQRYATARALAEDLRRFLRLEAIHARPPSVAERALELARRHRAWIAAGAAVVLALLAGAVWARARERTAGLTRLSVRLHPSNATSRGADRATATLLRVDPRLDVVIASEPLGRLPVDGRRVAPGYCRIRVDLPGFGFAELARDLPAGPAAEDVVARVRALEDAPAGMRRIDGGSFRPRGAGIGCLPDDAVVSVDAFWIDEAEVSVRDFGAYVDDVGPEALPRFWSDVLDEVVPAERRAAATWRDLPHADGDAWLDLPVAGVTWLEAVAYAEWRGLRLPTHLELERAMRGPDMDLLPWEDAGPGPDVAANVDGEDSLAFTSNREGWELLLANVRPVRDARYRHAPEGLFHAFGNVAEWTAGMVVETQDGDAVIDPRSRIRLGGGWDSARHGLTLAAHATAGITASYLCLNTGFRCARSTAP